MKLNLNYGKDEVAIKLPRDQMQAILTPNEVEGGLVGEAEVRRAMGEPIGSPRLKDIVRRGETVCVVTSDITRPMPSYVALPPVIEELREAGIRDEDITIVLALGNHRKHTVEERIKLVGKEIHERIRCLDSDQSQVVRLGVTSRGTPVDVFEPVAKADRLILMGNVEYHYFAGYSGGYKAIMPGVSTHEAIEHNHTMMVEETSIAGKIEGNNLRNDIEEVGKFLKVDFILNVVLDAYKSIVKAVAGHPIEAHREGCRYLDACYKAKIEERADIVLVSPGGFPKDINLYQAQKALDNAKHAVKPGGIIILCAHCTEGLGEGVFTRWMLEATSPQSMVDKIKVQFELGGHKAAAIGMVQCMSDVYLVSSMEADFVRSMFFTPFESIQVALDHALDQRPGASIIVMPYGGSTLPTME